MLNAMNYMNEYDLQKVNSCFNKSNDIHYSADYNTNNIAKINSSSLLSILFNLL